MGEGRRRLPQEEAKGAHHQMQISLVEQEEGSRVQALQALKVVALPGQGQEGVLGKVVGVAQKLAGGQIEVASQHN